MCIRAFIVRGVLCPRSPRNPQPTGVVPLHTKRARNYHTPPRARPWFVVGGVPPPRPSLVRCRRGCPHPAHPWFGIGIVPPPRIRSPRSAPPATTILATTTYAPLQALRGGATRPVTRRSSPARDASAHLRPLSAVAAPRDYNGDLIRCRRGAPTPLPFPAFRRDVWYLPTNAG
jgi:hypothetical protein